MDAPDDRKLDAAVRAALRSRRLAPGPHCLTPDALLELADAPPSGADKAPLSFGALSLAAARRLFARRDALKENRDPSEAERGQAHIAGCEYCRRELTALQADLYEADQLNAAHSAADRPLSRAASPALTIVSTASSASAKSSALPFPRFAGRRRAAQGAVAAASLAAAAGLLFAFRHGTGNKTAPKTNSRIGSALPPKQQNIAPAPEKEKKKNKLPPSPQKYPAPPKPSDRPKTPHLPDAAARQAKSSQPDLPKTRPNPAAQRSAAAFERWMKKAQPQITTAAERSGDGGNVGASEEQEPALTLLAPVGVVLETRPDARWKAAPEADRYEVTYFMDNHYRDAVEGGAGKTEILSGGIVHAKRTTPLKPGQGYIYQVEAFKEKTLLAAAAESFICWPRRPCRKPPQCRSI